MSQPDKEEKEKYIADFLCARHQGKPLACILSSNPPRNPMTHVPTFPSFFRLKVQNDHTAEWGKSQGQSQAAPFRSPWLLSTRQSCDRPLFNNMKLLRPPRILLWSTHSYSIKTDMNLWMRRVSESCSVANKKLGLWGQATYCVTMGKWLILLTSQFSGL